VQQLEQEERDVEIDRLYRAFATEVTASTPTSFLIQDEALHFTKF